MSIQVQIDRLKNAKELIKKAIEEKGVEISNTEKIDDYDEYIKKIVVVPILDLRG